MENVKNLVSKKFIGDFQRWIERLSEFGYTTFWKVLVASDYGIPQRRERVFAVSVRKDRGGIRISDAYTTRKEISGLFTGRSRGKIFLAKRNI